MDRNKKIFQWQLIAESMSDLPDNEFYKNAKAFLNDDFLLATLSRQRIQRLIAPRLSDLFEDTKCDNADEITFLGDSVQDIPSYLKFTVFIQGKTYCYYLNDLYKWSKEHPTEPYRRFKFNDFMKDSSGSKSQVRYIEAINKRYTYLSAVLTEESLLNLSPEEIAANNEKPNRKIQQLAIDITSRLPYFSVTPEDFAKTSNLMLYLMVSRLFGISVANSFVTSQIDYEEDEDNGDIEDEPRVQEIKRNLLLQIEKYDNDGIFIKAAYLESLELLEVDDDGLFALIRKNNPWLPKKFKDAPLDVLYDLLASLQNGKALPAYEVNDEYYHSILLRLSLHDIPLTKYTAADQGNLKSLETLTKYIEEAIRQYYIQYGEGKAKLLDKSRPRFVSAVLSSVRSNYIIAMERGKYSFSDTESYRPYYSYNEIERHLSKLLSDNGGTESEKEKRKNEVSEIFSEAVYKNFMRLT